MSITDIPILSMLRTRMHWAQTRQRILAENVANADTPNYRARDLMPLKFEAPGQGSPVAATPLALATTEPGHIAGLGHGPVHFATKAEAGGEVRPTGNAVNLEEEMMKVAANQLDYETATVVYMRSLNLIKVALGKR